MNTFALIVGILVAAGVWAYLFLPYLTSKGNGVEVRLPAEEDPKEQLMVQLAELEYDFRTGKMSKGDYEALRRRTQAAIVELEEGTGDRTVAQD